MEEQIEDQEQRIPLAKLHESPTNPRTKFTKIEELASSLKEHGMLQAIVARPHGTNGHTTYEIVAGHRRYRAAKLAELADVPVKVRTLTDEQVLELQLVENIQREDLSPLEEADGYRRLHTEHGYTVDVIAEKAKQSKSYVYAKLKLAELGPEGRALLEQGKISESIALPLARVPLERQAFAIKTLEEEAKLEGVPLEELSARQAADALQVKYTLKLADAPFNVREASLLPAAGACTTCPKKSGNAPELFPDIKGKDTCTDVVCFKSKCDAHWERTKKLAEDTGHAVIEGKAAKKIFRHGQVKSGAGFVTLDMRSDRYSPDSKSIEEKIGKKIPVEEIALARDDQGGVHKVVALDVLKKIDPKIAKQYAPKPPTTGSCGPSAAEMMRRKADHLGARAAMSLAIPKLEKRDFDKAMWRMLVEVEIGRTEGLEDVLVRRGFEAERSDDHPRGGARDGDAFKKLEAAIAKMSLEELRALFVELMFANVWEPFGERAELPKLLAFLKVDGKELAAKELARLKAEAKTPAPEKASASIPATSFAGKKKAPKKSTKKKGAKK